MLTLLQTTIDILPATQLTAFTIIILLFLFLMSVTSGAEVAFFTLNTKDINYLKTRNQPSSKSVINLLENPELLSSTLRASKYGLAIGIVIVGNYLANIFIPIKEYVVLTFIIIFIVITFLLLLIGEILPKVYARQSNVRMALFAAPIVKVMYAVFAKPAKVLLVDSFDYENSKIARRKKHKLDSKEFEQTVVLSMGHTASKEEVDIFKGILKFGNITVKQIMQPRLDVSALRETWSFNKVREKVATTGYTRMPVYRNSIDEIVGMILTKDLLPYSEIENFEWHSVIRPAFFVHEHKLIEELLTEFQETRTHFAIVVDEFGGTSGVVTLEDIIEEIIGDIKDEFDEEENNYYKDEKDEYVFDGKMLIIDIARIMGIAYDTFDDVVGESDSIAGLVLEISGKFPAVNDEILYGDYKFIVEAMDERRITKVRVAKASINTVS